MNALAELRQKDARFGAKLLAVGQCIEYTGAQTTDGYGKVGRNGKTWRAHRWAWAISGHALDPNQVLDHLCKNTLCVNPEHLRQVSQRTNVLAGDGPLAVNAAKAICKRGHSLTDSANVYINHRGHRECRSCGALRARTRRAIHRDALDAWLAGAK